MSQRNQSLLTGMKQVEPVSQFIDSVFSKEHQMLPSRVLSVWFGMRTTRAGTPTLVSKENSCLVAPLEFISPPASDASHDALHADYHARTHCWTT